MRKSERSTLTFSVSDCHEAEIYIGKLGLTCGECEEPCKPIPNKHRITSEQLVKAGWQTTKYGNTGNPNKTK